ncbi:MAG: KilA-N domain-containing protein [Peptostreptococcaceae bacterium]|nr:KilA-N domain-containing protein [Peptostreptococcaceae bacterium]
MYQLGSGGALQKWILATGSIGLISKAGRYGGTFAHKDIAFEFASWISAEFKNNLYDYRIQLENIFKSKYPRKNLEIDGGISIRLLAALFIPDGEAIECSLWWDPDKRRHGRDTNPS